MPYYSTDEVIQALTTKLDTNKVALGIKAVYYGEQNAVPAFPAVMVAGAPLNRQLHATRQFKLIFTAYIYVLDAKLSIGKSARIKVDLQEANAITELIHQDLTLLQTWF